MLNNDPRSRPRLGFIGLRAMGGSMAWQRTAQQRAEWADPSRETEVPA
jgi:hypothetical protein